MNISLEEYRLMGVWKKIGWRRYGHSVSKGNSNCKCKIINFSLLTFLCFFFTKKSDLTIHQFFFTSSPTFHLSALYSTLSLYSSLGSGMKQIPSHYHSLFLFLFLQNLFHAFLILSLYCFLLKDF